jgi:hypothetical protein
MYRLNRDAAVKPLTAAGSAASFAIAWTNLGLIGCCTSDRQLATGHVDRRHVCGYSSRGKRLFVLSKKKSPPKEIFASEALALEYRRITR